MEKLDDKEHLINNIYNTNDESNTFYNMFKLSKHLKLTITKILDSEFKTVEIYFQIYKKLSKDKIICKVMFKQLNSNNKNSPINVNNNTDKVGSGLKRFILINFNTSQLSSDVSKTERKQFSSNVIEEVLNITIDLKSNLAGVHAITDSYFNASDSLVKSILKSNTKIVDLKNCFLTCNQFNNLLEYKVNTNSEYKDKDKDIFNFGVGVITNNEQDLVEVFSIIKNTENIDSKSISNSGTDTDIDIDNKTLIKEINLKFSITILQLFNIDYSNFDLNKQKNAKNKVNSNIDLEVTFIKAKSFGDLTSEYSKQNSVNLCTQIFCLLTPNLLEAHFYEIYSPTITEKSGVNSNSTVSTTCNLFKSVVINFSPKFFSFLNSFKLYLKRIKNASNKNDNKQGLVFNFNSSYRAIITHCLKMFSDVFTYKDNFLQLNLNNVDKPSRFITNLINDYNSILVRKVTYENLFKELITKPKKEIEEIITSNTDLTREFTSPLIKYDINTASKLLQKIQGNSIIFTPDGKLVSVGGYFKHLFDTKKLLLPFNALIIFTETLNKISILTFHENYFLTQFYSNALVNNRIQKCFDYLEYSKDYEIIVTGGTSSSELISNFVETPVYSINFYSNKGKNESKISIKRLDDFGGNSFQDQRKLLFKHDSKIDSSNKYILLYGGLTSTCVSKGISIFEKVDNDINNTLVSVNTEQLVFEFESKRWYKIQTKGV